MTQFGTGQWRIGTQIVAGRYYSDPATNCYWERQRGFGGTTADIIANQFISYDALQWIVDIASTDAAFRSDPPCGTWFNTPRQPAQTTIRAGVWLVGAQVATGTYQANVQSGCYWERMRAFTGTVSGDVIANEFISSSTTRLVTIAATDVGFKSTAECGTWTRQ